MAASRRSPQSFGCSTRTWLRAPVKTSSRLARAGVVQRKVVNSSLTAFGQAPRVSDEEMKLMLKTKKLTAVLATLVATASSCAAGSGTQSEAPAGVEPARLVAASGVDDFDVQGPGFDVVDFDDDYQRFAVLTDPSASSTMSGDGDVMFLPATVVEVHTADGVIPVDSEAGSLRIVAPESPAETAALAAHDSSIVAMLLSDADGIILDGVPQRFVYTEHGLYTLDARSTDDAVAETDPAADANLAPTPGAAQDTDDLFSIPTIDGIVAAQIAALPGTVSVELTAPGVLAVTTESNGDDLGAIAGVASVHDELLFGTTADPLQGRQWTIENTGSPDQALGRSGTPGADIAAIPAWDVARGAGIVVAIIDSGVQMDHPDLAGRYAINVGETCGNGIDDDGNGFIDDCTGWDFGSSDANPSPSAGDPGGGHGTHVAGTVAAGLNGVGVVGVAPDAQIMALKVSDSNGAIRGSSLIGAINYATANGADVINLSLGTEPGVPRAAVAAIEAAVNAAIDNGVSVVVAAGNNGIDISSNDVWPASLSKFNTGVITVGASTNSDARAWFSNSGSPISLWAPGDSILSTAIGSSYEWRSGTSMATPTVAGAVAVLLSTGGLAPDQVRTHLQATSVSSSAGPRLDLASVVGASTAAAVSIQYRGAAALRPNVASTLSIDASASNATDATQLQLSVATLESGAVAAVGNLAAEILLPNGTSSSLTTSSDGSFPALPISDVESGITIGTTLSLPEGEYAFITELLTAAGDRVGGAQVAYMTVANPPAASPPESVAPTTVAPVAGGGSTNPPTTSAPAPAPSPATTVPAPTPAPPAAPVTSTAPTPAPQPPSQAPTTTPAPLTTTPPGTIPPVTTPPTTTPPTTTGPSTPPPSATPTPTTTTPNPGPPTPPAPPSPTPPAVSAPTPPPVESGPTTTAAPGPGVDGDYRLESMWPVTGAMDLSTVVTLTGVFPTRVPVFVWWEGYGPVQAHRNDGTQLEVRSPWVDTPGVADVEVRFTVGKVFELASPETFTFYRRDPNAVAPVTTSPGNGGSSSGGGTVTPPPASNDGGSGTSTPPTTTTTTQPPATTPPATPEPPATTQPPVSTQPPGSTQPPTTQPVTPSPVTTQPATPSPTPPAVRQRGTLTLSPPEPSTAMVGLSPQTWQSSCASSTCPASEL